MDLKDNTIPYIAIIIASIIAIIVFLGAFEIINIDKDINFLISLSIMIPSQIYYKYRTIPITEAISHYWKYKVLKQDKTKSNNNEDYASFKDTQNKNNSTK